jgi:hypothetical protein
MLLAHDQVSVMKEHDPTGKWKAKVKEYRNAWKEKDSDFAPDRRHDRLICFLFPEIADRLPMDPS